MAAERRGEGIVTALIYRRVSKEDMAREGMSLPAQLAETRRYCAERGWLIGAEFEDVLSGLRDDRPQYRALLAEVRRLRTNNQAVVVVVAALDRLGRRFLERVRAREELKALGVATHSVREGGEVSDLVANVLASVAEEEVRRLKERVTAVRRHAISNGYRPVGRSAWGYRWRQATPEERQSGAPQKVLEIDADRAPYVLELGQRVADGQSVRAAARWVQSLPAEVRDHREWTLTGVLKLLRAPVYVARPDDGDADVLARPVGRWPAIYSDDLWLRIQERIAGHARLAHQASGRYLLTGLLRCPVCGSRMAGSRWRKSKEGRDYYRYACESANRGASGSMGACQWAAPVHRLDAAVLAEVADLVEVVTTTETQPSVQTALRRAWEALAAPAETEDLVHQARAAERAASKARQRLTGAARALVDGILDKQGYELVRDEARAELEAAEAELTRLRGQTPAPRLPDLDVVLDAAGDWRRVLAESDVSAQRDTLALFVESVTPRRLGWRSYRVDITWTPLGEAIRAAVTAVRSDYRAG